MNTPREQAHALLDALLDVAERAAEPTRPDLVHQRNCEAVVGIPPRDYLRAAHAGHFPWTKERRLLIARTADVVEHFELRLRTAAAPVANDHDAEAIAFARVGARRVST